MTARLAWLCAGMSLGFIGAGVLVVVGTRRLRKALPL